MDTHTFNKRIGRDNQYADTGTYAVSVNVIDDGLAFGLTAVTKFPFVVSTGWV